MYSEHLPTGIIDFTTNMTDSVCLKISSFHFVIFHSAQVGVKSGDAKCIIPPIAADKCTVYADIRVGALVILHMGLGESPTRGTPTPHAGVLL